MGLGGLGWKSEKGKFYGIMLPPFFHQLRSSRNVQGLHCNAHQSGARPARMSCCFSLTL